MRYSIAPYIYPIMGGNDCVGQGFVADGFFITAAHVVKDNPNCYIKIGDPLLWENQVVGIMHGGDDNGLICAFLKIESFIFDIDITVEYDKSEIIRKLLPCGADRTTAIIILYALNIDITIMGIDLVEEGIYETGYYAVLDKLPFKIDELSKVEREVLDEYCTCVVHQTM